MKTIRFFAALAAAVGGGWLMLIAIRSLEPTTFYLIAMAISSMLSVVFVLRLLPKPKNDDKEMI